MASLKFSDLNDMNLPYLEGVDIHDYLRIMRLKGPIDKTTLTEILEIRDRLAQANDINDVNILIDMKLVTDVDSSCVVVLIQRLVELQQQNKLMGLINVPKKLTNLMDILRIETSQPILFFQSEEEAINKLSSK